MATEPAIVDPRGLGMDADRVAPKLYVGAYTDNDAQIARAGFTDVVRVARECPKVEYPLDDGPVDEAAYGEAMRASAEVCRALARGGRVLVTCAMGVNRSAFVAALAMIRYYGHAVHWKVRWGAPGSTKNVPVRAVVVVDGPASISLGR